MDEKLEHLNHPEDGEEEQEPIDEEDMEAGVFIFLKIILGK